MSTPDDRAEPDGRTLADLSALADGTLDPEREPAVRDLIADSPELRRRFERERLAVSALHAVRSDRAPAWLRLDIDARQRTVRRPRRRFIYATGLTTAVAAAVAALVLLLPGGTPGSPSVSQAAALALRGPAMAAPASQAGGKLNQDVQQVYFPDWSRVGGRATGQRIDRVDHRAAVTVFYEYEGKQVAYTILSAPALRWPGTTTRTVDGVEVQSFRANGRQIVTWRRAGHTCILSAIGVPASDLATLAATEA